MVEAYRAKSGLDRVKRFFSVRDLVQAWQGFIRQRIYYPDGQARKCFHFRDESQKEQTLKRSITSNWSPLLRAFCPFLIAIAVLLAMPRNARAQLYVTNDSVNSPGFVSEYDANTGARLTLTSSWGCKTP